jgi:hypothetical protein
LGVHWFFLETVERLLFLQHFFFVATIFAHDKKLSGFCDAKSGLNQLDLVVVMLKIMMMSGL